MQAHEPHPGVAVRVKEGHWKSEFGGMVGVVQGVWGHPDHPAVDVRLEDGSLELFWFHELDDTEEVIGHGSAVVN
jgi:hypothetical protein